MRPAFSNPINNQVLPASTDLSLPCPMERWRRMNDPPFPPPTMFGALAATASEPMDATGSESKIGSQWIPPSVLLKMPPDAAPTYQTFGFPGTPATDVARLPSGPMYRYLSWPYTSGLMGGCCACNKQGATSSTTTATAAAYIATRYLARFNMVSLSDGNEIGCADDTGETTAGQCRRELMGNPCR